MPDRIAEAIVAARRRHPTWGPKKLLAWLSTGWPEELWPADHYLRRRVSEVGTFVVHCKPIHLSTALQGEWIGLDETEDGVWSVYLSDVLLGRYDERDRKVYA